MEFEVYVQSLVTLGIKGIVAKYKAESRDPSVEKLPSAEKRDKIMSLTINHCLDLVFIKDRVDHGALLEAIADVLTD